MSDCPCNGQCPNCECRNKPEQEQLVQIRSPFIVIEGFGKFGRSPIDKLRADVGIAEVIEANSVKFTPVEPNSKKLPFPIDVKMPDGTVAKGIMGFKTETVRYLKPLGEEK